MTEFDPTRSCKLQCNIVSTAYPLGQAHHRHGPARDDVGEYLARTNRRQLVNVCSAFSAGK